MSIILRSGSGGSLADVTNAGELVTAARLTGAPTGGLPISLGDLPATSYPIPPGSSGVIAGPIEVGAAGNVTFIVKNTNDLTPWQGVPHLVFEQSDDAITWAALPVMRSDSNVVRPDRLLAAGASGVQLMFDAECEGANFVRCRVVTGPTAYGFTVVIQPGMLPFTPSIAVVEPQRTTVTMFGTNLPVGSTDTETALTLTRVRGAEVVSATSFGVNPGRTFRSSFTHFSMVGNSSSSAARCTFRLRMNPSGPVTTTSPVLFEVRIATTAVSGAYQNIMMPLPDGAEFAGDGVTQFGYTVNATYSGGAAPTVDVTTVGYEY